MSALQLGRIWASAPTSPNLDPGAEKYKLGYVAEIPVFQMLNYINNRFDTNTVALAERGVFEWGKDITYNISALAWDEADGAIYISKVANPNINLRPGANLPQWEKSSVQISRAQYDLAVANWSNHIANTSNPHQLTTEILNTYAKSVIDAKVAVVQAALNTHVANKNNPHNLDAIQVGAVPASGGSYTGLVNHLFASTGLGDASYAASLLSNASGTFLVLGVNAKLGIDNSKKAVFIDNSSVKSNLLLESDYIAARELVEASYVPPTPDCEIQLRNSLSIIYGAGVVAFLGSATGRAYLDKSGTSRTASLNQPRFTKDGLLLDGATDFESLLVPCLNNIQGATEFTVALDFKSLAATSSILNALSGAAIATKIAVVDANYVFVSKVGNTNTTFILAAVDHTKNHKVVLVSSTVNNKTYVYFDGVLKVTINSKQDTITSNNNLVLCSAIAGWTGCYYNSLRTWLGALTSQQVSNL